MKTTFENLFKNEVELSAVKNETKENLERLLKNAQSKKCRSKAMSKTIDYNKTIEIIEAIQVELEQYKETKNVDINTMTLEDVNKAIKNAQSKKCLAKAMARQAQYDLALQDEIKYITIKDNLAKKPKIDKIQLKINELKELKQTKEIVAQIKLLESLR